MLVGLNVDETPQYRKQFAVAGVPTVVVAKAGGKEIDRTFGFMKTADFITTVENYAKGIGTLAAMSAAEDKHADDPAFLFELGEKYFAHSHFDAADERFAAVIKLDSSNAAGRADDAQMYRAKVYQKSEEWPLAIAFCNALLKRWPKSDRAADAMIYAAWYSAKAGKTGDAIRGYNDYLARWPNGEDAGFAREQIKKLKDTAGEN